MHKSELNTLVIDCPREKFTESVAFWSALLGMQAPKPRSRDQRYIQLSGSLEKLTVLLQAVEGEPEIHLDLCTDDKEAEISRAMQLGAEEKYPVKRWMVMRAPSGHSFCIVPAKSIDELSPAANQWR